MGKRKSLLKQDKLCGLSGIPAQAAAKKPEAGYPYGA